MYCRNNALKIRHPYKVLQYQYYAPLITIAANALQIQISLVATPSFDKNTPLSLLKHRKSSHSQNKWWAPFMTGRQRLSLPINPSQPVMQNTRLSFLHSFSWLIQPSLLRVSYTCAEEASNYQAQLSMCKGSHPAQTPKDTCCFSGGCQKDHMVLVIKYGMPRNCLRSKNTQFPHQTDLFWCVGHKILDEGMASNTPP